MAKVRVPLWGKPMGYAAVDTEATKGATLGENLYRADGSVVTEADLAGGSAAPATPTRTLWSLIQSIPANISALAALATSGFAFRAGDGTWSTSDAPSDGNTYGRKNAAWVNVGSGGSGLALVGSATVAGSAASDITVSGLDLATDGAYLLIANVGNATGSSTSLSLYYNGDTTASNYYSQFWSGVNTATQAARNNNGVICSMDASGSNMIAGELVPDVLSSYPRATLRVNRNAPASVAFVNNAHVRNNSANVTSITISSSVANSLAVGSYVKVYKIG